jgi:hypothetical protein
MAANTTPIFVGTPRFAFANTGVNANTAFDGTGSNVTALFTAGASGSKVETVTLWNSGSNVATVVRFFMNNGSTVGTASNNSLLQEVTWPINTASQTAASAPVVLQPNWYLPSGYKLYITIGTATTTGIAVSCQGGDF